MKQFSLRGMVNHERKGPKMVKFSAEFQTKQKNGHKTERGKNHGVARPSATVETTTKKPNHFAKLCQVKKQLLGS